MDTPSREPHRYDRMSAPHVEPTESRPPGPLFPAPRFNPAHALGYGQQGSIVDNSHLTADAVEAEQKHYAQPRDRKFAAGADAHSVSYRDGFNAGQQYAPVSPTRLLIVADTDSIDDISGIPHGTITAATLILSIIEDGSVKVLKDRYGITQGATPGSWLVYEGAENGAWQVFPEEAGR